MKTAILYARFSPRPNAAECESCERQLANMREWCERNVVSIRAEFKDESVSGADDIEDRPGLWEALSVLAKGDILLAYDQKRLARDMPMAMAIERQVANKKARIVTLVEGEASDDAMATMVRRILQAIAEYERKIIAARVSAAMKRHQANGRRMGPVDRVPFGWRCNEGETALRPNEHERQALARMQELRKEGASLATIALTLENEKFRPRGRCWHTKSIARLLEQAGVGKAG